LADGVDGAVAPRAIDKRAIVEDARRGVWREGENAPGCIGQGAVGEEGVVPEVERCLVEVDAVYNGIARIVAAREGDNVARTEEGHGYDRKSEGMRAALVRSKASGAVEEELGNDRERGMEAPTVRVETGHRNAAGSVGAIARCPQINWRSQWPVQFSLEQAENVKLLRHHRRRQLQVFDLFAEA